MSEPGAPSDAVQVDAAEPTLDALRKLWDELYPVGVPWRTMLGDVRAALSVSPDAGVPVSTPATPARSADLRYGFEWVESWIKANARNYSHQEGLTDLLRDVRLTVAAYRVNTRTVSTVQPDPREVRGDTERLAGELRAYFADYRSKVTRPDLDRWYGSGLYIRADRVEAILALIDAAMGAPLTLDSEEA